MRQARQVEDELDSFQMASRLFVETPSLPAVTLTQPPTLPRPTLDLTMSTMELTLEVTEPSAGTLTIQSFSDLEEVITNLFSCLCANPNSIGFPWREHL